MALISKTTQTHTCAYVHICTCVHIQKERREGGMEGERAERRERKKRGVGRVCERQYEREREKPNLVQFLFKYQ